jgi:type IV pilus assembly protein PilM
MKLLSGIGDFFGLDIGTSAIRIVELQGKSPTKVLGKYAFTNIDPKIALSDAKADQQKLVHAIKELISQSGILTKNVAVNLPSQRVFTTVVDIERLAPAELAQTIRFQADSLIPTPLAQSKIDWALLGDSPVDKTKVEVLLSSVSNEYIESRLDMLESIGLNIIAFEPDNQALVRSLTPPQTTLPLMIIDVGNRNTDIIIVMNGAPRLMRSIPTGTEAIIRAAEENLNIDQNQANQFVFKFGLSKDKLEGQIYHAILGTIDLLVSEIDKSIKFFNTRYNTTAMERIIVTGGASALPEFPLYIANKFGVNVEIGNAWHNVSFPPDRQNELLSVSNHFGVAVGLAEREE